MLLHGLRVLLHGFCVLVQIRADLLKASFDQALGFIELGVKVAIILPEHGEFVMGGLQKALVLLDLFS